jgi:carboxyl-terminal processing protease
MKNAIILSCATLALLTGCNSVFVPEPLGDPEAVFENLWTTFEREYANFEARGVDWKALYAQHRPLVSPATTDKELFQRLSQLLRPLDDGHVSLSAPGEPTFLSNRHDRERTGRDAFDPALVRDRYLEPDFHTNRSETILYGLIRGSRVGYFHVRNIDREFANLGRMLDAYPELTGLIVDLRQNGGGNHTFAFSNMGRLTNETRYVFRSRTKNGPGPEDYTPWHEWHLRPSGPFVPLPVVVLTDRRTPSAAERTVMAFRSLPGVIVLGDTTNGSISTKIPRELANGWYYSLSPQQVEMFDGQSYEGRGLPPDEVVRNELADLAAGIDRLLLTAVARLSASAPAQVE